MFSYLPDFFPHATLSSPSNQGNRHSLMQLMILLGLQLLIYEDLSHPLNIPVKLIAIQWVHVFFCYLANFCYTV